MSHKDLVTQGYVGEFRFNSLLTNSRLQQVGFDSLRLIEAAEQLDIGSKRLHQASPYLRSEYGTAVRTREGKNRIKLEWQHIPAEVILDKVYGLDAVINFRGWTIGIDVTTNPNALVQKQKKLNWLAPLWKSIGVDCIAVVRLFIPDDVAYRNNAATSELMTELRKVIKERKQVFTLAI